MTKEQKLEEIKNKLITEETSSVDRVGILFALALLKGDNIKISDDFEFIVKE